MASRDSPVRRPFTITLKPWLHTLFTLTLDAAFGASELWLIGEGDASIAIFDRETPLFVLKAGGPPLHLRGLTLHNPVRVEGSGPSTSAPPAPPSHRSRRTARARTRTGSPRRGRPE